jgi:3-oxoacyl-[acyl-carrier protein] reductase
MDLGLKDATAVVVGGGRGMGFATARCFADDGARVAVVGRSRAVLDRAAEELTRRGSPDAIGIVADVGDAEAVEKLFTDVEERWNGELNVLINAVGQARSAASKT